MNDFSIQCLVEEPTTLLIWRKRAAGFIQLSKANYSILLKSQVICVTVGKH